MSETMTPVSYLEEIAIDEIPKPAELRAEFPLTLQDEEFIANSRNVVKNILNRWDQRILLVVGPCSIHDWHGTLEYAYRLRKLADQVADRFFIVMRAYFEKPRTIIGWKGLLYDPDLNGTHQFAKGIWLVRSLLTELTKMGMPVGSELLEITTAEYFSDFLSWGCIGARTCASPPHRQLAASLPFPVGFKNTMDGNLDNPIHAILSAKSPHTFLGVNALGQLSRIQTKGNPFCHVVLRGGIHSPNYYPSDVQKVIGKCRQANVCENIMIDCSHDNCEKQHLKQIAVFDSTIDQLRQGNQNIMGIMLESFLESGCQPITPSLRYGISITDPCIDWETTVRLLHRGSRLL